MTIDPRAPSQRFAATIAVVFLVAVLGLATILWVNHQSNQIEALEDDTALLAEALEITSGQLEEVGVEPAVPEPAEVVRADALPGSPGPRGPRGERGRTGPIGPIGEMGFPGSNGVDGANGSDGIDGQDGTDGVDGADGAQGPQGELGPTGPQGEQGPKGEPGDSPTTVFCTPPLNPMDPWTCSITP